MTLVGTIPPVGEKVSKNNRIKEVYNDFIGTVKKFNDKHIDIVFNNNGTKFYLTDGRKRSRVYRVNSLEETGSYLRLLFIYENEKTWRNTKEAVNPFKCKYN